MRHEDFQYAVCKLSSTPILDLEQDLPQPPGLWLPRLIGVMIGSVIVAILILADQNKLPQWHWPAFNGLLLYLRSALFSHSTNLVILSPASWPALMRAGFQSGHLHLPNLAKTGGSESTGARAFSVDSLRRSQLSTSLPSDMCGWWRADRSRALPSL